MKVAHYETSQFANLQAKTISRILGIYITVEKDSEGFYLSTKYAQGLTPKA